MGVIKVFLYGCKEGAWVLHSDTSVSLGPSYQVVDDRLDLTANIDL